MAGLGGTDFDNAMKTLYLGPLNLQVFRATVTLDRLEKNKEDVSGLFAYVPLVTGRNPAIGSRTEPASTTGVGAKIPPAGRQSYSKATFKMIMHYGQGSVSGGVKRKARNSAGAFATALDIEMKGLMESLPEDLNRDVWGMGCGRAAALAENQAAAKTTFGVYADGHFRCRVGDRVHIGQIAAITTFLPATGTTISDITFWTTEAGVASPTQHRITVAAACGKTTAAADAFYFGAGGTLTAEDSSHAQSMLGLQALIDDGDIGITGEGDHLAVNGAEVAYGTVATGIGGIDRDVNPFWQSHVMANAGVKRALTQTLMQEMWLTLVAQNGGNPEAFEIFCHPSVWGTLGMMQVGSRIYNDYKSKVEMGWTYIDFNGTKVFYDRDAPDAKMYFLSMKHVFLLTQNDYEFMDDDGKVIRLAGDGTRDAWSFVINRDMQAGINNARKHGVIKDIAVTMNITGKLH